MSSPRHAFTVILSTFNEENRVEYVLRNFQGRANLIVVDNFSTDRTAEIARRYTDQVILRRNPGSLTPECYRFRFELSPTDYVLMAWAGQLHPPALVALYDQVARSGSHKAIVSYNVVYSYGRPVTAYTRPYANKEGRFRFAHRDAVDLSRSVIHDEMPFKGKPDELLYPPKSPEYCIISFRDDTASASELKHTRYADIDAKQRYESGARTSLPRMLWVFNRHLWGCLLWRGAIWQGLPGIINSWWRANYFINIEIRIWEMQAGLGAEAVKSQHKTTKGELLRRLG